MDATRSVHPTSAGPSGSVAAQPRPVASVALVLPAYNEQEVIEQAIAEADEALAGIADDYEVLVVDDGSRDATRAVALQAAEHRPAVRVISHETNRGYGAALRTGFQAATKDYVGFSDADCQFNLRETNRLTLLLADCDIACGYRIDRQDKWHRIVYSKVYNALVRLLLGTGVRDCDCALKMFRRETLAELPITTNGFLINAELLTRARMAGKSVVEVGVTHRPRPRGQSTVSFLHILPVLFALLRFWWSIVLFPSRTSPSPAATPSGPASWGRTGNGAATALLGLLAGLLFLGNLAYPFVEPDESRYAQVSLEMLQSGDFVVPRLLGEPYLDKPPLLYWATAASFQAFGPHEFGARFPSALAAVLTVLITFGLGTRLFGSRPAFLASLMLLLSLGFVLSGRFLIMDGPLALFTTVCLLASFLAVRGPQVRLSWWLLAAVACSLGILTKGPVAVVLVVPPLVSLLWLDPRHARVRIGHWLAAIAVILLVTAPWFILIAQRQGEFASHFLWKHHVLRFVSAFNHQAPVWYYLPVLFLGMFPSSLLFGPTLGFLFGRRDSLRRVADGGTWRRRLGRGLDPDVLFRLELQVAHVHSARRAAVVPGPGLHVAPAVVRHVRHQCLGAARAPLAGARHRHGRGDRSRHCGPGPVARAGPRPGSGGQLRRDRRVTGVSVLSSCAPTDVAGTRHELGCGGRHVAADHGIRFPEVRARVRALPIDQCQCGTPSQHGGRQSPARRLFRMAKRRQFVLPAGRPDLSFQRA